MPEEINVSVASANLASKINLVHRGKFTRS